MRYFLNTFLFITHVVLLDRLLFFTRSFIHFRKVTVLYHLLDVWRNELRFIWTCAIDQQFLMSSMMWRLLCGCWSDGTSCWRAAARYWCSCASCSSTRETWPVPSSFSGQTWTSRTRQLSRLRQKGDKRCTIYRYYFSGICLVQDK